MPEMLDSKVLIGVVFFVGFVLGLVPINLGYHYADETVYLQHGEILAGESPDNYNEFDFRPPFLSLMLGGVFMAGPGLPAAHALVAFLSSLGIVLVFLLGRDMFDQETGLLAAAVYGFSPLRIGMAHDIMVDSFLPLFWLAAVYSFYRALESDGDLSLYTLSGFFTGLAVLVKFPSLALLPMLFLLYLLHGLEGSREPGQVLERASFLEIGALISGFIAILLPYLAWSWSALGSPVAPFINAWMEKGAADPLVTYLAEAGSLIPLPFLLGIPLYFWKAEDSRRFERLLPLLLVLGFFLPMQFLVSNREIRYLLPVVPFLGLIAARGLSSLPLSTRHLYVLAAGMILLQAPSLVAGSEAGLSHGFYRSIEYDRVNRPADWLKENTPEEAPVYTNLYLRQLAYYSKRPVSPLAEDEEIQVLKRYYFDRPGYVYHSNSSHHPHPTFRELISDPDFALNRSFESGVSIFYYRGG